jgi:hypothetical protein
MVASGDRRSSTEIPWRRAGAGLLGMWRLAGKIRSAMLRMLSAGVDPKSPCRAACHCCHRAWLCPRLLLLTFV